MADVSSPQSQFQSCFLVAAAVIVLLCTIGCSVSGTALDHTEYSTVIYVDSNNGTDNSSCLTGEIECATINMALRGIIHNWTTLYINPGTYFLENGNETAIVAKQHITIAGTSDYVNSTIIYCEIGAGILFSSSFNVTIANISFVGCGMCISYELYNFQAAIATYLCHDLFLINVHIHHSNGTGLLTLKHRGEIFVNNCTVSNSIVDQRAYVSNRFNYIGGGIFIFGGMNSNYTISNSVIRGNNFGRFKPYYTLGECTLYDVLDFTLAGISTSSFEGNLTIDSTHVFNNSQGLFMAQSFNHFTSCTRIINSTFYSNNQFSKVQILDIALGTSILFYYVNMSKETLLFEAKLAEKSESALETFWGDKYMAIYNNLHISISPATENYLLNAKFKTMNCNFNIISYRGLCSNISNHTALCPYSYSTCAGFFCSCANGHTGRLCGKCKEGYSVPVNSPSLSCVNCSDSISIVKGWAVLIAMEFMPLTFMVVLIAVLNVNLNQGSLNAFVFFCQILSISFPSVGYPTWFVTRPTAQFLVNPQSINIALFPLSIWNMDFITVLGSTSMNFDNYIYDTKFHGFPVCVSSSTSPLGAIIFWYLIAFYPILLLLLMYVCIIAYDRGYRGCVCILRPLHYLLARFWRKYDIKPSLITTTASIITLCFTQIAAVSLKLLHPVSYKDPDTNKSVVPFFYDGTQDYFNGLHLVSAVIAMIILFCLISIIVFLILNPFLWFHRCCVNRLPFRKDFLISLTEVFTAPFKHGIEGNSLDYRYFASALFSLRLIIMCFYYVPQYESNVTVVPIMEVTLCCLYIGTIVIFRPYKRTIHVFVEMMQFAILGAMSCCMFYEMPKAILFWRFVFPMYMLVLVIAALYCGFWIAKKIRHASYSCCKSQSSSSSIEVEHYDDENSVLIQSTHSCSTDHIYSEQSIPDRVLHPDDYNEILAGDNEKPA